MLPLVAVTVSRYCCTAVEEEVEDMLVVETVLS